MKKYLMAAIAAIAVAVPVALPAVASAWTVKQVTQSVIRREGHAVKNRLTLIGAKFEGFTAKCGYDAGRRWSCYITYTAFYQGEHVKYGALANVGQDLSITPGKSWLIRSW